MALTRAEIAKILLFGNPKKYTWATKPSAASVPANRSIFITDVGGWNGTTYAGSYWYSDGTLWHPVSGSVILARSSTQVTAPGDTAENTLYTYSIAAGLMGPTDSLRITTRWTYSNNANSKMTRIRIAATELAGNIGANAYAGYNQAVITNRAINSQLAAITTYVNTAVSLHSAINDPMRTGAVDMTAAQNLTITAQKATGGDTMALESVLIELLAG